MANVTERADVDALIEALSSAARAYEAARERVDAIGENELRALTDALCDAERLLARYESRATGTGDFEAFVTFQSAFADHTDSLPEDLPHRDGFERAADRFDKRRLSSADFEYARGALADARDAAARLDDRRDAREDYRDARHALRDRRNALRGRIEELERVRRYGRADLDAPVEELQEPIAAYNGAVRDAFETYLGEESARVVLSFVASTAAYPLVSVRQPPDDLVRYVDEYEAGTESIPTLVAYSEYSTSKLGHYVSEPEELRRYVATHRTYLTTLDSEAFEIGWPPPPARRLWWRTRELISVVSRFAPADAIAKLRAVREVTRNHERYERLREAGRARAALDERARERLRTGETARELRRVRDEHERLGEALAVSPPA